MPGTRQSALKAKKTMLKRDKNYYATIGAKGGKARVSKGFGRMDKEKAQKAGKLGGSISRKNEKLSEVERIAIRAKLLTSRDNIIALHEDEEAEKSLLIKDNGWFEYIPEDDIVPERSTWWQRLRGL